MLYFQTMRNYELTIILDGKATAAKKKSVREAIEKTIGLLKGKVGTVIDWGEKELASRIGKSKTGIFVLFPLEMTPDSAKKLAEKIKTEDAIIRYLLIRN